MYSVVLMMAMTTGADAPAGFFKGHSCHGGYGSCTGEVVSYGCTGSTSYGCTGSSWGCTGSTSYGCCGGHSHHAHKSHESHGCCGGGGFLGGLFKGHKSHGCCGGGSCYGTVSYGCTGGCVGTPVITTAPAMMKPAEKIEKKPEEKKPTTDSKKPETEVAAPAAATLVVTLPADAKLMIDDAVTASTSTRRIFTSPALPVGQAYHYTLRAEFMQDGKPVVVTKTVAVRAGEQIAVAINADMAGIVSR
jgi:uncharacterized protein (TIGR03000 family)